MPIVSHFVGGYMAMTTFSRQLRSHLTPGGRALIFFRTSGDLGYLQQLVADRGFAPEVVAQDELTGDGWRAEYYAFRLS